MTSLPKPSPRYFRYVDGVVPSSEAAKAQPITIVDLPSGDGGGVEALNGVTGLWLGTQAEYDAIETPSPTVAYIIQG